MTSGQWREVEYGKNKYCKRGKENEGWIDQGLHRSEKEIVHYPQAIRNL